MTANPHHSVSVAGIVVRADGRILAIQRRDTGQWQPPGGILQLDETFEDGVRREVAEETGVAVEVERLTVPTRTSAAESSPSSSAATPLAAKPRRPTSPSASAGSPPTTSPPA